MRTWPAVPLDLIQFIVCSLCVRLLLFLCLFVCLVFGCLFVVCSFVVVCLFGCLFDVWLFHSFISLPVGPQAPQGGPAVQLLQALSDLPRPDQPRRLERPESEKTKTETLYNCRWVEHNQQTIQDAPDIARRTHMKN